MSKSDGLKIGIRFTEDLIGDVSGNEESFTITGKEYQYVNGNLLDKTYIVDKVERYPADRLYQDTFENGVINGVNITSKGIILDTGSAGGGYTDDLTSELTYISTTDFSTSYANHMAFDNDTTSSWAASGTVGQAVGVDFGIDKKISKLRIMTNGRLKNFDLEGSNDNSAWTVVYSGTQLSNSDWQEYMFENSVGYRYYRVKCTGSLYNGSNVMITEIEMMESLLDYVEGGDYTTAPIQINGQYRLSWVETKPTNTNIIIKYTTGETQGQWQVVSNGDIITSDTNLWIRATLSTEDTTITPTLKDLWIEEPNSPQDKILITMDWWGRFNNVEGKIKVLYDSSKGSLTGAGGAVESFEIEFTPQDLIQTPNPNEEETIKANPYEIVLDLKEVDIINVIPEETIKAYPYEIVLNLINADEINP